MIIGGVNIVRDPYIQDQRALSLLERLFSWPWRPWIKFVYDPQAYIEGNTAFVSFQSYNKMINEIERRYS
jgi:hypothetical protein